MVAFVDQKEEEEHGELPVAQAFPLTVGIPVGINRPGVYAGAPSRTTQGAMRSSRG